MRPRIFSVWDVIRRSGLLFNTVDFRESPPFTAGRMSTKRSIGFPGPPIRTSNSNSIGSVIDQTVTPFLGPRAASSGANLLKLNPRKSNQLAFSAVTTTYRYLPLHTAPYGFWSDFGLRTKSPNQVPRSRSLHTEFAEITALFRSGEHCRLPT